MQANNSTITQPLKGEVLERQNLEPLVVRGSIELVISNNITDNHLQMKSMLIEFQEVILKSIRNYKNNPPMGHRYLSTKNAARYLNVDESFLNKRKGSVFLLGKHYFKPEGESIVRWDIEALDAWLQSDPANNEIDDEIEMLLNRS